MAPTPAAMKGTRAPEAKNFVATAMPKRPVALSRAMIDHVMCAFRELSPGRITLHAARVGGGAAPAAFTRCRREPAFGPIRANLNDMAAFFQLVDGRLWYAVFHHQHARPGSARPK